MILGIHGSVRRGYMGALEEARQARCEALQVFSYRRHHVDPAPDELRAFADARRASAVSRLLVHVRYLPSLASSDPERREHSVGWLARELKLSTALGAEALVIHAGAYSEGGDSSAGMAYFVEGARKARDLSGAVLPLLVENVPGGGRRMCGTLEEMAELGGRLKHAGFEVGYCLDTAHAWAQGYEIATAGGMDDFIDAALKTLGGKVRAFHLNDTLAEPGSHRESHWHWGEGKLGKEGLGRLLSRPEFKDAAAIVESPKDGREAEDFEFVRGLRA